MSMRAVVSVEGIWRVEDRGGWRGGSRFEIRVVHCRRHRCWCRWEKGYTGWVEWWVWKGDGELCHAGRL